MRRVEPENLAPQLVEQFQNYTRPAGASLAHVLEDQLGHFEHADPLFSIENFFELVIRVDESLIRGILEIVPADVVP